MEPSSKISRTRSRQGDRDRPIIKDFDYRTSPKLPDLVEKEKVRKRLERLSWLTDNSIPIPGFDAKIGIDPLIGLIPWIGDALGAIISSYIITQAANLGAPKPVLLKMSFNVVLDALIGVIPGIGDLFDFAWKANMRNVQLLEDYIAKPAKTVAISQLFVAILVLLIIGAVLVIGMLGFLLIRWLWTISGY